MSLGLNRATQSYQQISRFTINAADHSWFLFAVPGSTILTSCNNCYIKHRLCRDTRNLVSFSQTFVESFKSIINGVDVGIRTHFTDFGITK